MADESPTGSLFTASMITSVDGWSRCVFESMSRWSLAQQGSWTRWPPGYLLLEITQIAEEQIDPVVIYTADDEITVSFGYWETHLPEPGNFGDEYIAEAVQKAMQLVEDWLSGRLKTAVFTDRNGKWCGSKLVEDGDLTSQLNPERVASFKPTEVEVRTPRKSDWRRFRLGDGRVLEIV